MAFKLTSIKDLDFGAFCIECLENSFEIEATTIPQIAAVSKLSDLTTMLSRMQQAAKHVEALHAEMKRRDKTGGFTKEGARGVNKLKSSMDARLSRARQLYSEAMKRKNKVADNGKQSASVTAVGDDEVAASSEEGDEGEVEEMGLEDEAATEDEENEKKEVPENPKGKAGKGKVSTTKGKDKGKDKDKGKGNGKDKDKGKGYLQ